MLARFVSADTLIPGVAPSVGGGGGALGRDPQSALRTLTVDFHEPGFAAALSGENRAGGGQRYGGGPLLPQALNRYSYTLNNPLLYVDPSGHQSLVEYAAILILLFVAAAVTLSGTQSVRQAVRNPPSMAGEPASPPQPSPPPGRGVQTTSKTLYNKGGVRVDVENPRPAQRPGQVHVQVGEEKYIYDPLTGAFKNAPKSVQKLLENKEILNAIQKGVQKYLGIEKWKP